MERLLSYYKGEVADCVNGYDASLCGITSEKCDCIEVQTLRCLEELKAYRDDEEQGLLFRISCPEGSEVYVIDYIYECKHNFECPLSLFDKYKCEEDIFCEHTYKKHFVKPTKFNRDMEKFLGETVFLTRNEAEKKLEEIQSKYRVL